MTSRISNSGGLPEVISFLHERAFLLPPRCTYDLIDGDPLLIAENKDQSVRLPQHKFIAVHAAAARDMAAGDGSKRGVQTTPRVR